MIFVFFIQKINSEECFYPKELNMFVLGASCYGTPSATPCKSAFDYNYNTAWSPPNSNFNDNYYSLNLNQKASISYIEILQSDILNSRAKKFR